MPLSYDVYDAYFIALDTNPTTQVFESSTGTWIANSDADYATWLTGDLYGFRTNITGAANNGSGLIRLTVDDASSLRTGMKMQVREVGGTTEANGTFVLTKIDATHVDLQGSTFTNNYSSGGYVSGPAIFAAATSIYEVINDTAAQREPWSFAAYTISDEEPGPLVLTNPLPSVIAIDITADLGTYQVHLPAMNLPTSLPIGMPCTLLVSGENRDVDVYAQDGTTVLVTGVTRGDAVQIVLKDNSTANGEFRDVAWMRNSIKGWDYFNANPYDLVSVAGDSEFTRINSYVSTEHTYLLSVAPDEAPGTPPSFGTKLDTDGTLAGNSDTAVATQKATKAYALGKAVEDQALTGGAIVTSKSLGTITSGTVTPNPGARPMQHYTNGGAHTLGVSANAGTCVVDITNNGSAGAITTSGFTKVTGDSFTTTNGHKFRCLISIGNGGSLLQIVALQ